MEVLIQSILLQSKGGDSSSGNDPAQGKPEKQLPYKKKLLLPGPSKTHPIQISAPDTGGEGFRVLLFNDDFHEFKEVENQLMKALKCTREHAVDIMMRAHNQGRAVVTIASLAEAARVAGILREIALNVAVDKV
jgi:ATP-dependent Clp protease adapter protein ClpS